MIGTQYRVDERTIDGMQKFVPQKNNYMTLFRWKDIGDPVNYKTEADAVIEADKAV